MKNLISFYYNINVESYKKSNDKYSFISNNKRYIFLNFTGNIEKIYNLYLFINKKKYCHKILINKDGNIITLYNTKKYVMIEEILYSNKILDINDIYEYLIPIYDQKGIDWKKLWIEKLDYYEYQVSQFGKTYKKVTECFSYYAGLCENAISILNYVDINQVVLYICHNRIKTNEILNEYYNPLNFIVDSRVRDIAEYIKVNFFNKKISLSDVFYIIDSSNFDYNEILLFLSRIIYPSYFFDVYDKIIQNQILENEIEKYIEKNTYYEVFLHKIYKHIKKIYKIPLIEWLE